jgi:hypothetical protein
VQVELQSPPLEHPSAATLVELHVLPQPPQLEVAVVDVSHPFVCMSASQFANPAAQVPLHVLATHVRVATLLLEQSTPQPPQLSGFVLVSASQPFDCRFESQLPNPATHAPLHAPATHALPDTFVPAHATPHAPQFAALVCRFVSQPLACRFPSQLPKPLAHVPPHTPARHALPTTFAPLHATPHPPQFVAVVRSVSHPSVRRFALQSPHPLAHGLVHAPPEHVALA